MKICLYDKKCKQEILPPIVDDDVTEKEEYRVKKGGFQGSKPWTIAFKLLIAF